MRILEPLAFADKVYSIAKIGHRLQQKRANLEIERKADNSLVTRADRTMEAKLMALLKSNYPDVPILSEEGGGTKGLDLKQAVKTGLWSVDPLDGTKPYAAGLPDWAVSVVHFEGGRPHFAVVAQPGYHHCFMAMRGKGISYSRPGLKTWTNYSYKPSPQRMLALDYASNVAANEVHRSIYHALITKYGFFENKPSVTAGLELALGHTFAWVSGPAPHHWDPAAGALFIEECGGVAECLDGGAISWDQLTLPRLLFAESAERAAEVRSVLRIGK